MLKEHTPIQDVMKLNVICYMFEIWTPLYTYLYKCKFLSKNVKDNAWATIVHQCWEGIGIFWYLKGLVKSSSSTFNIPTAFLL